MLTKREQRVIDAFIHCVEYGEFTEYYAVTLLEDDARYGWLTESAKEVFYEALRALRAAGEEPDNGPEITEEP
ncbi:MAG: hypothetical protein IK136_04105 [Oscillospiraceae bacterium]|nr:hypothetical protein [Oscillospiraceae bacterium]